MLPDMYLSAETWQKVPADVFFAVYDGSISPVSLSPVDVYRPAGDVPSEILIRTSEREKRLEADLTSNVLTSGPWGSLYVVDGDGSQVGLVLIPKPGRFCGAHVMPDVVHLLGNSESVANDAIIKDIHIAKSVRLLKVGSQEDEPHDIVFTTKLRWFRNRNNPKHLGFSKEEK